MAQAPQRPLTREVPGRPRPAGERPRAGPGRRIRGSPGSRRPGSLLPLTRTSLHAGVSELPASRSLREFQLLRIEIRLPLAPVLEKGDLGFSFPQVTQSTMEGSKGRLLGRQLPPLYPSHSIPLCTAPPDYRATTGVLRSAAAGSTLEKHNFRPLA